MATRSRSRATRTSTPAPAPATPAPAPAPVITSIKPDAQGFAIVAQQIRQHCKDAVTLKLVTQTESVCQPYTCTVTGTTVDVDWAEGFATLCNIADTACEAGTMDKVVIKSIYRLIGSGQEVKPRVTSEVSAIKRSALKAGRNLAK